MLLRTPESKVWWPGFGLSLAGLFFCYLFYHRYQYTHGGSWPGIISGVLAFAAIIFLMAFSVIKRRYQSALGNLQAWLYLHIYLGLLVLFVALFHSGLRFNDWLAVFALLLLTIVVLSGVIGALLYTSVPPKLAYVEATKSVGELSVEMNQVIMKMRRLAATRSAALQRLADYLIEAERPQTNARWRVLFTYHPRRRRPNEPAAIGDLKAAIDRAESEQVEILHNHWAELKTLHEQLIDKQRYVNLMTAWLYLHLPLSFALLAASVAHIVAALHFRFW